MKKLLAITVSLFLSFYSLSQNREEVENWLYSVENEFPEIDKSSTKTNLTSGSTKYNLIRYNLLSDKYFIPVFGKSFDQLNQLQRNRIWSKVAGYKQKKKLGTSQGKYPWAQRLDWYMWGVFRQTRAYNEAVGEVQNLRKLRNDYNANIQDIISENIEFHELINIQNTISSKFSTLLPSEISRLEKVAKDAQIKIANRSLLTRVGEIEKFRNTLPSLRDLEEFRDTNIEIYNQASSENQMIFDKALDDKREEILSILVANEINKLDEIDFENRDIYFINEIWNELHTSYARYKSFDITDKLFSAYKSKKTNYVSIRAYSIAQKARELYTIKELEVLNELYLSNTYSTANIDKLNELITSRMGVIEKYLRDKEEEQRRIELERANLIKERKAQIDKKRTELEIKYESNLPTIEDIFDIMMLGSAIKDQASQSDQQRFKSRVERMGYMMTNNKFYSDINTFRNNKGWEIYTLRLDDDYNNQIAVSGNFEVKNAPREIIELYVLELTTEYRKTSGLTILPWNGEEIKKESDNYVKSGSVFFSYKLKDGDLTVTALDNWDAKGLVAAELIGDNKIKITPWTNYTHISLKRGDQITLEATGSITLGVLSVACYPEGISGFRTHNIDGRFNHGCLIGKIGDGEWFYVGSQKTITADRDGFLQLRINDDKESDNGGHFEVSYSFN